MDQYPTTTVFKRNQGLSVTLTALVALVLMTTLAFAQSDSAAAGWTIRPEANPDMNVAQWYAAPTSFAVSSSPWTIRADANPDMNVAHWYAAPRIFTADGSPWTIRAEAKPDMNVAQWYAAPRIFTADGNPWTIRAEANPDMNVAQWYVPASSGTQDVLCTAEDTPCP